MSAGLKKILSCNIGEERAADKLTRIEYNEWIPLKKM
jgi:hypothetical protein